MRIVTIGGVAIVGLLLVVIVARTGDDPVYQGRRLSSWFLQYALAQNSGSGQGPFDLDAREAMMAMRALGSNALPWLAHQAFDHKPRLPLGSNCVAWVRPSAASRGVVGRITRTFLPRVPKLVPRINLCQEAIEVVSQLQVPAEPLLNLLREHLERTNDLYLRVSLEMLSGAKEEPEKVLPYLIDGLQRRDVWTQSIALRSLEQFGAAGKAAIPVLLQNLRSWPSWISMRAITVLGNFGPDAAVAAPDLEKILHSTNQPALRARAAVALCQIRGRDEESLALISRAMLSNQGKATSPEFIASDDAWRALGGVQAFGAEFISLLEKGAERDRTGFGETHMSGQSIYLLNRLAPEKAFMIWRDWMRNDPRQFVRANSAHQLLQLQGTNGEAVAVLCGMARTNLRNRAYVISFIGEANLESRLAVQTLEGLAATNDHPALREMAHAALDRMHRRAELARLKFLGRNHE